jgi:hypothetical protein
LQFGIAERSVKIAVKVGSSRRDYLLGDWLQHFEQYTIGLHILICGTLRN